MIKKMISNNKIKQIGWKILKKIKMSYSNKNNPNLQYINKTWDIKKYLIQT